MFRVLGVVPLRGSLLWGFFGTLPLGLKVLDLGFSGSGFLRLGF